MEKNQNYNIQLLVYRIFPEIITATVYRFFFVPINYTTLKSSLKRLRNLTESSDKLR